jgi:hypothetical protein
MISQVIARVSTFVALLCSSIKYSTCGYGARLERQLANRSSAYICSDFPLLVYCLHSGQKSLSALLYVAFRIHSCSRTGIVTLYYTLQAWFPVREHKTSFVFSAFFRCIELQKYDLHGTAEFSEVTCGSVIKLQHANTGSVLALLDSCLHVHTHDLK